MSPRRRADLTQPGNIDEARQRLIAVNGEIATLQTDIDAKFRFREDDGLPMSPIEHFEWRNRARGALGWFLREQTMLIAWIETYERDVKAEEEAEQRQRTLETQRANAKDKRARAEVLRQRDQENNEWRDRMIREHGTTKLPPHIARAQMIELEKLGLEREQQRLAAIELSERHKRRKQTHKEWLERIGIDDPVNGLDPDNLLKHALRLLRRLREEGRVDYSDAERELMNVIEQRFIILADLDS